MLLIEVYFSFLEAYRLKIQVAVNIRQGQIEYSSRKKRLNFSVLMFKWNLINWKSYYI